jgi:hypothetical protein
LIFDATAGTERSMQRIIDRNKTDEMYRRAKYRLLDSWPRTWPSLSVEERRQVVYLMCAFAQEEILRERDDGMC